jgi:hypothetical protein
VFSHRSDPQGIGHRRLTASPARTDLALLIRRAVRLIAVLHVEERVVVRWGWVGEINSHFDHPAEDM